MKRYILLLTILGIVSGNSGAEVPTMLSTVVVSATRSEQPTVPTPASITVITGEEIAQSGARNLAELLRARAGIQVSDYYGDGSGGAVFDMRGFGAAAVSNTLVMVDGRRLNNAADMGAPDVTTISLNNIERIEIIQGSAGTLFGNQAVGGVINIITRRPQEFHADVDLTIGSFDSRDLTASISDRFSNGISYRIAAEKRSSENYRDNNHIDYENLTARLDFQYDNGNLFGEIHHTQEYLEMPGALFADEVAVDRRQSFAFYANDNSDTETNMSRVGIKHTLTDYWVLEAELAYRDVDRPFIASSRFAMGSKTSQWRHVYTFTPRLIGNIPMLAGEGQFTFGADYENTDYYLNSTVAKTEIDQNISAYYAQAVIPIHQQWSVTAGMRHAKVKNHIEDSDNIGWYVPTFPGGADVDDGITVRNIGIVYRPDDAWRLFARADENFRFAKVDEHTNAGGIPTGLKNQTGISYEIGAEWTGQGRRFKAVAYRLNLEDEIGFDFDSFGTPLNINIDSTRRKGLILEGMVPLTDNLDLTLNYNYVDAQAKSGTFAGKRIPLVAEHSTSLFLDYRPMHTVSLHAEVKYVGDQILGGDYANTFPKLDSFTVVNLSGEYRIDGWRIGGKVNNLLDREYSETGAAGVSGVFPWPTLDAYFPSPERNFWLTLGRDFY